jgi:hypothetical protein
MIISLDAATTHASPYHPRYCEENAWHLCLAPTLADQDPHVVIVTNRKRRVAMWLQRAAPEHTPVAWDYHVFVVARTDGWQVWDPDTRLGMPVALQAYLDASFATVGVQPPSFDPRFRILRAHDYRDTLRSDRSHMLRADGSWQAPPPPWPGISAHADGTNLERFIDLGDPFIGHIVDFDGLVAHVAAIALP